MKVGSVSFYYSSNLLLGARGTVVVDSRQLIKVFQVPELSNRAFIGTPADTLQ